MLLVVSVARYMRSRKMRWLILASAAFTLSYATKEATFLTILTFGAFAAALIVWEIGSKFELRSRIDRLMPAPVSLFHARLPRLRCWSLPSSWALSRNSSLPNFTRWLSMSRTPVILLLRTPMLPG